MWIEKLGPITDKDCLSFNTICRWHGVGNQNVQILWQFTNQIDAAKAFGQWKQESEAMKTETVAAKEYKFNLSIKLSPQDVENIIRDRIVHDNPGIDPQSIYMEDDEVVSYEEKQYDGYTVQWRNK